MDDLFEFPRVFYSIFRAFAFAVPESEHLSAFARDYFVAPYGSALPVGGVIRPENAKRDVMRRSIFSRASIHPSGSSRYNASRNAADVFPDIDHEPATPYYCEFNAA